MSRGRVERIVELLSVINRNPDTARYRVAAYAGLNIAKGNGLIDELSECGFVTSRFDRTYGGKYVTITAKGFKWLHQIQNLLAKLNNGTEK